MVYSRNLISICELAQYDVNSATEIVPLEEITYIPLWSMIK
jgi:hypothetical protein